MIKFAFACVVVVLCIPGALIAYQVVSQHLLVVWH